MCLLEVGLLSVTFDPETAEIRLLIVTHSMKIKLFSVIADAAYLCPHKSHWTQTNQNLPDVRGLKDLTIRC